MCPRSSYFLPLLRPFCQGHGLHSSRGRRAFWAVRWARSETEGTLPAGICSRPRWETRRITVLEFGCLSVAVASPETFSGVAQLSQSRRPNKTEIWQSAGRIGSYPKENNKSRSFPNTETEAPTLFGCLISVVTLIMDCVQQKQTWHSGTICLDIRSQRGCQRGMFSHFLKKKHWINLEFELLSFIGYPNVI